MARRAEHSRDDLTERAAAAVADIVGEGGYGALTMRNVARRIGYSVGTLYNLFDNLDDMVLGVNGRTLDALDARLAQARITGRPQIDLGELLDIYLTITDAHPKLCDLPGPV